MNDMTTGNKETIEFIRLPVGILNAVIKSMADGRFDLKDDIANFIQPLLSASAALQGAKLIPEENVNMTIPEREQVKAAIRAELPAANEDDRYDLTEGLNGVLSFIRLAWRRGKKDGAEEVKQRLEAAGVNLPPDFWDYRENA